MGVTLTTSVSHSSFNVAAADDYQTCRQIMQAASRNYSFASKFFPPEKLHHVEALYAFLRVGDDRVDVSHEGFASKEAAIKDWEKLYWRAWHSGGSPHPVIRAYLNTAIEHGIPADVMATYFRAMKEDLAITRFPTFDDLLHYMEGSAIPVGRGMTYILGTRNGYTIEDALPGADALSIAMQLSNFWRDIGEDYHNINRIYIPQEDMARFNYSEDDLAAQRINQNLVDLLEFQFERTERYYEQARRSISMLAAGRWAVMSGLEIYRAIITTIRHNRYDVFNKRAAASTSMKLALVAKARIAAA
jgi:phytoene synthase